MKQYLKLVKHILDKGTPKTDRTGTGTLSVFGYQMRFDLTKGFPLLTTKRMPFSVIATELAWFLSGSTNINFLTERNVHIWDEWADMRGELGPVYGKQWRSWDCPDGRSVDQISWVIQEIKTNPDSRRLIVSAWNVADLPYMALPPCHLLFQFYVANGKLSCQLYQRSADVGLGVPFNIASYSFLVHIIARKCGLGVGDFVWSGGDCHIYLNHVDGLREQLCRIPNKLPKLAFTRGATSLEDFYVDGYIHHPAIKLDVAV